MTPALFLASSIDMKNFIEKFHDWEKEHDVFRGIGAVVFVAFLMLSYEVVLYFVGYVTTLIVR